MCYNHLKFVLYKLADDLPKFLGDATTMSESKLVKEGFMTSLHFLHNLEDLVQTIAEISDRLASVSDLGADWLTLLT